ncbi:MAG: hypothetical protein ACREBD_23905 [Blastocatellia bacterium]
MTIQVYERLILEAIKGLPPSGLDEIVDFIFFVRKREARLLSSDDEFREAFLRAELKQLSRDEESHLEQEFAGYERLHLSN